MEKVKRRLSIERIFNNTPPPPNSSNNDLSGILPSD